MADKSMMMTRILINRYHAGSHPSVDSLPAEEQKLLEECKVESSDVASALQKPWNKFEEIHYSWLVEPLRGAEGGVLPMLLASLPGEKREKICKMLGISSAVAPLPVPIAHIMATRLYNLAQLERRGSGAFLPSAPLDELLTLGKNQLVDLIDCLSMLDLSLEIPQLVDRTKLSVLVDALRPVQQRYLKRVLHYKGKWTPPKLGIDSWGGKREKLLKALHKRGMMRLALALSDHSEEWRRFFLYKLDTGRAQVLQELFGEGPEKMVLESIQQEIRQVVEFLR